MVVCFCFDLARTHSDHSLLSPCFQRRHRKQIDPGERENSGAERERDENGEQRWMDRLARPIDQQVLRWRASERASKMPPSPPPMKSELFLIASQQFRSARLVGSESDQHRFQIARDNGLNVQCKGNERGLPLSGPNNVARLRKGRVWAEERGPPGKRGAVEIMKAK